MRIDAPERLWYLPTMKLGAHQPRFAPVIPGTLLALLVYAVLVRVVSIGSAVYDERNAHNYYICGFSHSCSQPQPARTAPSPSRVAVPSPTCSVAFEIT